MLTESIAGLPVRTARELIDRVGEFSWHDTVIRLAVLSSALASNCGGGGALAHELLVAPLLRPDPATETPRRRVLAGYLRGLNEVPPVASEASIYFLQALALLHGRDDGPAPWAALLASWCSPVTSTLSQEPRDARVRSR